MEQPSSIYFSVVANKPELGGKKGREQKKKSRESERKKRPRWKKAGKEDRRVIKEGAAYCIERQGRETLFLLEEWFLSFLFDKPMKEEY